MSTLAYKYVSIYSTELHIITKTNSYEKKKTEH